MQFEWDEAKNTANIQKHGFDFVDGAELFGGAMPFLVTADEETQLGEERWSGIGTIRGRVVVAIFTERRPSLIRFISIRKANREERQAYEQALKDELGSH